MAMLTTGTTHTGMSAKSGSHAEHSEDRAHQHGDNCGHPQVPHSGHIDYLHDQHRHAAPGAAWVEH
jgi:zinc transport system permease protein